MLSAFPLLFSFSFFAPTLLRAAAGALLMRAAARHYARRNSLRFAALAALIEVGLGIALAVGFLTQVAALIGLLYVVALLILGKRLAPLAPYSRSTLALLAVVLLSLLLTGAGALAFDLPL